MGIAAYNRGTKVIREQIDRELKRTREWVMSDDEPVTIEDAKCIAETDKAILCKADDFDGEELWIPKSQVHDDSEVYGKDHEGKLVISAWIARKLKLA